MKDLLKQYFQLKRIEKRGILILISLVLLLIFLPKIFHVTSEKETVDFVNFQSEVTSFKTNMLKKEKQPKYAKRKQVLTIKPVQFNPNNVTIKELTAMGLTNKMAKMVVNYREKVKPFESKSDFKQVYAITDDVYQQLENYIDLPIVVAKKSTRKEAKSTSENYETFDFDPNTASKEDLKRLGFSSQAIRNIIKYRAKGQFYNKEKVGKMYGVSEADYNRLKDYIKIRKSKKKPTFDKKSTKPKFVPKAYDAAPIAIQVNEATEAEWQKLRGIGKGYAKRIVKFRSALGGFVSIEQVGKTYGLPDSTFQKIRPFLKISLANVQKINLNTVDLKTLGRHPYIKKHHANAIINYRKQHGNFQSLADLKKMKAIKETDYDELLPYLKVE